MIFRLAQEEIQLGAKQDGPIKETLESHGLSHENYNIPDGILPPRLTGGDFNGEKRIGSGAERSVYHDRVNNIVKKYPHGGTSLSHGGKMTIQTTHFDKLIESFERVMELRVFARVLNEYNHYYARMHPQDAGKLPYMVVPKSKVDKHAIIHEPLLPEDRRAVETGEYKKELMNFMPKVIKDLYVYFDPFGGGNAYQAGYTEHEDPAYNKRPKYHMIDGANLRIPRDDMEYEMGWAEKKHNLNSGRFTKPFDRVKTERDILKFKEIISRISAEELKRTVEEIHSMF